MRFSISANIYNIEVKMHVSAQVRTEDLARVKRT